MTCVYGKVHVNDDITLHLLYTPYGKLFTASEIATKIFYENPNDLVKKLRAERYNTVVTQSREVHRTITLLGVPTEENRQVVNLLSIETLEHLLRDKRREHLVAQLKTGFIDHLVMEARKEEASGNHELAIRVVSEALKYSKDMYGNGSIALLKLYLLLARCCVGLGKYGQAEEYLALGSWCLVQNPSTGNAPRAELAREFGKLYAAQEKYTLALKHLAEDIYFSALDDSPEGVTACPGYYHMGLVFRKQGAGERAMCMWAKLVTNWMQYFDENPQQQLTELEVLQYAEAHEMTSTVMQARQHVFGNNSKEVAEACVLLGLLLESMGDVHVAYQCTYRAKEVLEQVVEMRLREMGDVVPNTAKGLKMKAMTLGVVEEALWDRVHSTCERLRNQQAHDEMGDAENMPVDAIEEN